MARVKRFVVFGRVLLGAVGVLSVLQLLQAPSLPFFSTRVESPCRRLARREKEEYTTCFRQRHQKIDPDGLPYAYHRWKGDILPSDLEKSLAIQQNTVTFKIINNRLYTKDNPASPLDPKLRKYRFPKCEKSVRSVMYSDRVGTLLNQLLFTLHVFDIPDVEAIFSIDDITPCGLPFVAYSIDERCGERGGFTIPSHAVFNNAFGPKQLKKFVTCLDERYPLDSRRITKAVWRGSTTGSRLISSSNVMNLTRIRLATMGIHSPHLLDVGVTKYVQVRSHSFFALDKEWSDLQVGHNRCGDPTDSGKGGAVTEVSVDG